MQHQGVGQRRRALIEANLNEYGPQAAGLPWVTSEQARAAEAQRTRLLQTAGPDLVLACKGTKPHLGPLSPGC
ncbi:MAG: hypothetical protein P8X55_04010, partial [Desulfosarcinaceae bacterium]